MLGHRLPLVHGRRAARVVLVACALMALSGCGRKGPLEPPLGVPQGGASAAQLQQRQDRLLQDADTPGLMQSPDTVYERSAIAKLNAATSAPPPRPINAPPAPQPSTFLLDPLVK